jgi:hypothetical protein
MIDRESMKRYLLGTVSPEERTALEDKYLCDVGVFEELREVENDLLDSYVRGKLVGLDRQEFEKQYLRSPERRARVQFASALAEIWREPGPVPSVEKSSFWQSFTVPLRQAGLKLQLGLAVGAMAMVVVFGWMKVAHDRGLQLFSRPPQVEQAGKAQSPTTINPQSNSPVPSSGSTSGTEVARTYKPALDEFTVQLTPGISRSGGTQAKVFAVPPRASWIKIQLPLDDDDHPTYAAVVETPEGNEIQHIYGLKSHLLGGNKVVVLRMASTLVHAGDYIIKLSGIGRTKGSEEELEVYTFRIVSR